MTRRGLLLVGLIAGGVAAGHPKGFHKRLLLQTSPRGLDVLVLMDVDGGERTRLLRASMDADGNGVLGKEELAQLKARLASLATGRLRLVISGYELTLVRRDVKVDLRGDNRASDMGISVAVLLEALYPQRPAPMMALSVTDESPDDSHIRVELSERAGEGDAGQPLAEREMVSGETLRLPLAPK